MAGRCGCTGGCSCVVTGACGTTVTGRGTPSDPYIVSGSSRSFAATDTGSVDHTVTTATTTDADGCPVTTDTLSSEVVYSTDAGNTARAGSDGGVYAEPSEQTYVVGSGDTVVTGSGTAADPYVVHSDDCCPTVVPGPSGRTTVTSSTGPDGQPVYTVDTAAPASTVVTVQDTPTVDLTISGTGTPADPYVISGVTVGCTPFTTAEAAPCNDLATAPKVFCGPDGKMYAEAQGTAFTSNVAGSGTAITTPVASGSADSATTSGCYTNNTCTPQLVTLEMEAGNADLNAQGPNTTVSGMTAVSYAVGGPAPAPVFVGGRAVQSSNQVTGLNGATANNVVNVASGTRISEKQTFLLSPGQQVCFAFASMIRVGGGATAAGSGSVGGGRMWITAVPVPY